MSDAFLHLGLGRHVRCDLVVAVLPIEGDTRGPGRRTLVWVQGLAEPLVASRSEEALIADLEEAAARRAPAAGGRGGTARRRGGRDAADQDALF